MLTVIEREAVFASESVVPKSKEVFDIGLNAFLERRAEREQELVAELRGKPADVVTVILVRIAQKHRYSDPMEQPGTSRATPPRAPSRLNHHPADHAGNAQIHRPQRRASATIHLTGYNDHAPG